MMTIGVIIAYSFDCYFNRAGSRVGAPLSRLASTSAPEPSLLSPLFVPLVESSGSNRSGRSAVATAASPLAGPALPLSHRRSRSPIKPNIGTDPLFYITLTGLP
jgi:hypothetical protein